MADIGDDGWHAEYHLCGVAILHPLAVDVGPEAQLLRIGNFVGRDQPRSERREAVRALAFGRTAATLALESPFGDVVHQRIAGDVIQRLVLGDVARLATDYHRELDFPIEPGRSLGPDDRIGRPA